MNRRLAYTVTSSTVISECRGYHDAIKDLKAARAMSKLKSNLSKSKLIPLAIADQNMMDSESSDVESSDVESSDNELSEDDKAPKESTPTRPHTDNDVDQVELKYRMSNDILDLILDLGRQAVNDDVNAWSNFKERIEGLNEFYTKNKNCLRESHLEKVKRLNEDFLKWSYRLAGYGVKIIKIHKGYAEIFDMNLTDQIYASIEMLDRQSAKRPSREGKSSEDAKRPRLRDATHSDSGTSSRSPKISGDIYDQERFIQNDFQGQQQSTLRHHYF